MLIEETQHEEKLPKIDPVIDIYSVIAKFLNNINYKEPVIFPLTKDKFIEIQTKLHELTTGTKFYYNNMIHEFDGTFEGRLFTFIKTNNPQSILVNDEQSNK
jgi:hypothetical protein